MLRLRTLGGLSIERSDGPTPGNGLTSARRRLALLAVLAVEPRGMPRDRLIALFWPESDSERARHALDQSLYSLRRELKTDDLFIGREELSLNPDVIQSDVGDLRRALERGDREAAVERYTGPFLDGVFVPGAPDFERWVDEQRLRLTRAIETALEFLATDAGVRGEHREAVGWWQRLAAMDPRKTRVVVSLMMELAASGDRAGALRQADVYQTLARDDLDVEPNPAVAALAERLRREPSPNVAPQSPVQTAVASPRGTPFSPDPSPPFADRYAIEREIGWGGTATVYLARDLRNDRRVALKVLRAELAAGVGLDRFRQEIALTANLQHPHILPVHDSGEADGTLYFVMPFVEGESLRARLERERRLSVSEVVRLAQEIGSALAYAHARGIVHRDVKPENILITSGHAVVADFGLARALDGALPAGTPRHTEPGLIVGTPAYLSPEQAIGDTDVDARSDQYTLGALLYEALAGAQPFAFDRSDPLARRDAATPTSLRARRSDVPEHVDRAILRALSPDPSHRFEDVSAFTRALAGGTPATVASPPATPVEAETITTPLGVRRSPSRRRIALMVAGTAVFVFGAAMITAHRSPISERAWIVVANFEDRTSDTTLGPALDAALNAGLEQSAYVNVVPRARVWQTLAAMRRDTSRTDLRVTEAVAREVAQREGVAAVIAGTIDQVGDGFLLNAKLVDATTGASLAAEQQSARQRTDIIDAIDALVRALRRDIGESRASVDRHDRPLPRATTRSLEALRRYAEGITASQLGHRASALTLWEEAVALDSDFALAHAELGAAYYFSNDRPAGDRHFARALSLMDRLTDRERFIVRAAAASWRGDRLGAIALRRSLLAEYPDDPVEWGMIGYDYMRLGMSAEAVDAYRHQIARDSTEARDYINMATSFSGLDQPDSALAYYRRAFSMRPSLFMSGNLNHEYGATLVRSGRVEDARAAYETMLTGDVDQRARGERSLGLLAMYRGHYAEAVDHFRRAVNASFGPDRALTLARNRVFLAAALLGRATPVARDSARVELQAAHAAFRTSYFEPDFLMTLGKALARDGQVAATREVLDTLRRRAQPQNGDDQRDVAVVAGELAMATGRADSAVRMLSQAFATDSSPQVRGSFAMALARAGDLAGAARVYEGFMASASGWFGNEGQIEALFAPLAAGRLYDQLRDTTRARLAYERVLAQWPSPDADLPAWREARDWLVRAKR